MEFGSKKIASVAIQMVLTESREEENKIKRSFAEKGISTAAVDYGREFIVSVKK